MIGEVPGPEKKSFSFLQNLFHIARESYYRETSFSPEQALKETLKEVNSFIRERGYGGKSDIALLASKNFSIYLAKIGQTKVVLVSDEKTNDIGEELENTGSNLFCNMVSGKMKKKDKLIITTSEIYNFFKKGKIIGDLSQGAVEEAVLERISVVQKEKFPQISGVALIIDHTPSLKEGERRIVSKKRKKKFSFKKLFLRSVSSVSGLAKIKRPSLNLKPPTIRVAPSLKIKNVSLKRKSFALPLLLVGVIVLGSLVIGIENNIRRGRQLEKLSIIEEKILQGKSENNLLLLEEALSDLEIMGKERTQFEEEIEKAHHSLKETLFKHTSSEEIEEMLFLGEVEEINPDKIISKDNKLYLFSDRSSVMVLLDPETGKQTPYNLPTENEIALASFSSGKIILFSPPDKLIFIENETVTSKEINIPQGESFVSLSSFLGRPYFLTSEGNIIRYTDKEPLPWLGEEESPTKGALSIAIDGSIFVLTGENEIYRYHEGEKIEKVSVFTFPSLTTASKIHTSPEDPLFLTDSKQKRVIILNKDGNVIKQLFHDDILKLRDITITGDQKKIYLLIGKEIYSIDF